ncbi:MAG: Methyltransferase domain [Pseudomonadota bacterium]
MDASHSRNLVAQHQQSTAAQVESIAGIIAHHLHTSALEGRSPIREVVAEKILPFCDRAAGQVLPADKVVLANHIPGYQEPSAETLARCHEYSARPENYGTAPGPAAALLTELSRAISPKAAFVFGTGRGRLEQVIAESSPATEVVTIDLPSELVGACPGSPDKNNMRYRTKIGIDADAKIGDIFRGDPELAPRVHQILGDSFAFQPGNLAGTMGLIVVDGNHAMPVALMDLANALELAASEGAVIVLDDFRKKSCLNAGVEAAAVTFSQITGLPVLQPCPKPGESGLEADAGIIIVPADFDRGTKAARIRDIARALTL